MRGNEPMNIFIPSPLRSYTLNKSRVEGTGETVSELLENLDRKFPGIRFRIVDEQDHIRSHIKIFVNREQASSLALSLHASDEILIICALSGG
jgi:molybdopterin synthase sulfur carrier subunit